MTRRLPVACQSAGMWGDLGAGNALEAFLTAVATCGYAGVGAFDTHLRGYAGRPQALRDALAARGLRLVAVDALLGEADDSALLELARFLAAVDCGMLVLIGGQGTDEADYQRVAARLNALGAATARLGVTVVYHHHSGTIAATAEELDRLVRFLDSQAVGLLADTGHIAQDMHVTPAAFIRRHAAWLRLVECKDFAPQRGLGYEVGQGNVDFPAVVRALEEVGYTGWLMVEQNTTAFTPTQSAALSRSYLREQLGV